MDTLVKILKKPITATVLAILFGFIIAAVVLAIAGYDPIASFGVLSLRPSLLNP